MRPDHPDVGAYVTFTTPDHEAELDRRLFGGGPPVLLSSLEGNGHNLYDSALKVTWTHAMIDVAAEATRRRIWTDLQGRDDTYYCSSSYLDCMLHENAVTSALDAVCLLSGKGDALQRQGFRPSEFTVGIHGVGA